MSFCIICSLRRLNPPGQINPEQHHPFSSEITRELEDLHRFSFNSLLTLLAVLTISGSKSLLPAVLALLIYTISLRLAVNTCFLQNYPTLTRFLHTVPLLATSCMAGVELVVDVQSPAIAVLVLLLSVLPFITTLVHHGRRSEEPALPIRMSHPPPIASVSSETTNAPN